MKYVAPQLVETGDEILVVAASIGTKKRRSTYHNAVRRVMRQVLPEVPMQTAAWRDDVDTGLQIADYCAWALKRKWEDGDTRSYGLISDKVNSEFEVFRLGERHYY